MYAKGERRNSMTTKKYILIALLLIAILVIFFVVKEARDTIALCQYETHLQYSKNVIEINLRLYYDKHDKYPETLNLTDMPDIKISISKLALSALGVADHNELLNDFFIYKADDTSCELSLIYRWGKVLTTEKQFYKKGQHIASEYYRDGTLVEQRKTK
jgi:hypothetical protein